MKQTIKHLQPVNKTKAFFAALLTLLALYLAFDNGYLYGFILLGLAVKMALREGIELELSGVHKYRKVYSLFGWDVGTWKTLPEIEYISVFKTKKKSKTQGASAQATFDFVVYKVNLFHSTNKHLEVYMSEDKEDAFAMAKQFEESLQCEIHDAT